MKDKGYWLCNAIIPEDYRLVAMHAVAVPGEGVTDGHRH